MKIFKNPWIKALALAAGIILIFLALRWLKIDFSNISENEFNSRVKALGVWGPLIYIVLYVLRPLIFFPAGILSAAAGITWGPLWGFVYLQLAANLSSTAEFFLARYFARGLIERRLKPGIVFLDQKIERRGFITVLLIRLIPNVAWDIQNFSLGLTKVKFRDYFWATLIGIMPGSFAFVFFGASLIKVLFEPKNLWIMIAAVLFFAGIFYSRKYVRKKQIDKK